MLKINAQGKQERIKREEPLTPEEYMGTLWLVCFACNMEVMTKPRIEKITWKPPKGLETETSFSVKLVRHCPRCNGTYLGRPLQKMPLQPGTIAIHPERFELGVLSSHPEILMGSGRILMD